MRLPEIEHGDGLANRLLIRLISMVSGMRLPDAARVAFYHKDFFGDAMGAWTQAAMRGPSPWSVAERELMACVVAKWNACAFCVGAHGAVAAKEMQRTQVDQATSDFRTAPISGRLKSALAFLELMTLRPGDLNAGHARAALDAGLSREALTDAIAIAALFGIVTRYAEALDFAMPTPAEFERAADMLLKRGYAP
ncbi:MAG: carboxymuconolactone decarboxylase family protein [Bradyrhizobium sp.]|uniref:carboxymuconolactone decarboxylase family protein n=1 Tax=Bradyrhizobium sp. TaxID=376 RepID=UPI001EC73481|nr:carboxymuconolactone decarboxylase family protein [Bradyrhizobium sp.]MBU6456498.1 carboxymuconolactone decarboxylase family protein [Bradyrhizobium sp.]MDE2604164.1 carboxymuconolactone decarboxylase family protein [Bradyrhizobium sp.]